MSYFEAPYLDKSKSTNSVTGRTIVAIKLIAQKEQKLYLR